MTKKKALEVVEILAKTYPNARPALNFTSNYELLIAVILSAQCSDERVNKVTKVLFQDYNTAEKIIELGEDKLKEIIYPCGLYKNKAKNIISASKSIVENFGGEVPKNYNDLITLAGVGRKTANVVSSVGFSKDAIAVDTHVFRVSKRIGLALGKTPLQVEKSLMKILPKDTWSKAHHYLIWHGRQICKSRKPNCESCPLIKNCKYYKGLKNDNR